MAETYIHGGDIYSRPVTLDFSVNTNPLGPPAGVLQLLQKQTAAVGIYPDASCRRLRHKIGEKYGEDAKYILCGNGASELLFAVTAALSPKRALLPVPSFLEYERALIGQGTKIDFYPLSENRDFALEDGIFTHITPETDILFLCTPGNPTGQVLDSKFLEEILQKAAKNHCFVVVDESFLEFLPDFLNYSVLKWLGRYPNVILISGFTKLYALAGIRLGYGICHNEKLLLRIQNRLPCWNVSSLAQLAGEAALKETAYLEESRLLIKKERERMEKSLTQMGFRALPSSVNFICFQDRKPEESGFKQIKNSLYETLLNKGILIRDCNNYRGMEGKRYYRIGIKQAAENEILRNALWNR